MSRSDFPTIALDRGLDCIVGDGLPLGHRFNLPGITGVRLGACKPVNCRRRIHGRSDRCDACDGFLTISAEIVPSLGLRSNAQGAAALPSGIDGPIYRIRRNRESPVTSVTPVTAMRTCPPKIGGRT